MNEPAANTIYARATAPGRAALAVIRLSGPDCIAALSALGEADELAHPHAVHAGVADGHAVALRRRSAPRVTRGRMHAPRRTRPHAATHRR